MAEEEDANFAVIGARAVAARKVIVDDERALERWATIKADFVASAADKLTVKKMLDADPPKFGQAILKCLQIWQSNRPGQATYDNLIAIFTKHQLKKLADHLGEAVIRKQIFRADQEESVFVPDKRFCSVPNFAITVNKSGNRIRETILRFPPAVENWSAIKDILIRRLRAVDTNLKIDRLLDEQKQQEAVLLTLESWASVESRNANFHKLLWILHDHGQEGLVVELTNDVAQLVVGESQIAALQPNPELDQKAPAAAAEAEALGAHGRTCLNEEYDLC